MKEYIVHEPKDFPYAVEKYTTFFGEPIIELIRCKDCKYFYKDTIYGITIPGTEFCIFTMNNRIEENDFCSRAKRRDDGAD